MKKILKLMLVMLAVCGISCEQLGGGNAGGDNGGNDNPGGDPVEQSFAISVTEITSNSAYVSVVPTNDETYYFDIIEKEYLDQYADKTLFATELVAEIKEYYEYHGYSLTDALSSGADAYYYEGELTANTEFYAYAVGVAADGTITTAMVLKEFKTLENGNGGGNDDVVSNNTFNISVSDITANSAQVSVTPSNNDTYYFDVIDKSILDQYSDKKAFAAELVSELTAYLESYGIPLEYALSSGADGYFYDGMLDANTEYYAIAFGVSSNGAVTTNVTTKEFKTSEGGNGGNTGNTGGDVAVDNLVFANYENYGDYYQTGAANWYIQLQDYAFNNLVIIEVQTALDATSFAGTFNINDTYAAGTAVGGFIYSGYYYGTVWVGIDDNGQPIDDLLAASGTVSIVDAGNGNYTLTIDAADENGRKLNASYTGAFELFPEGASLSNWSNGAKFNKRHAVKVKSTSLFKKAISTKAVAPKAVANKSLIKKALMK